MSNENAGISKNIFSVDLAGDLDSVSEAFRLVRTVLSTLMRGNVPLAGKALGASCGSSVARTNHNPNVHHIQISIFERSMS